MCSQELACVLLQGGGLSQLRNIWRDARFRLFVVRSTQALLLSCSASSTTDAVIIGALHVWLRPLGKHKAMATLTSIKSNLSHIAAVKPQVSAMVGNNSILSVNP